jgi:50S ribosomal protein L16 3-hydroxylase
VGEGEAPTLLQEGLHLRLGYPEGDATTPPGTDVGAVQYLREVRIDGRAQPQVAFLVRFARVALRRALTLDLALFSPPARAHVHFLVDGWEFQLPGYGNVFMKTGLAALVHPRSVPEFLAAYANHEPFVVHDHHAHTAPLTSLPFLASLDVLLRSWPGSVQAHLPDVRDEASSIEATARDARKLYDNGIGLLFNDAHLVSPLLSDWLELLRRDLGLPALTFGRCLIYATPDGGGTAAHFDQNINFVLQVHGTKKWTLAPNRQVTHPLCRHTIGQPADPELTTYMESPMPASMPDEARTLELKPGSLLFVPRGYWHRTEAEGDALALNFTLTAPTWLDLFGAALRSRLALSPEWRETADGVSDPARREAAARRLDDLLSGLVDDLPNWRASDILDTTESDTGNVDAVPAITPG